MRGGPSTIAAERFESGRSAAQRKRGFGGERLKRPIACGDIGRVGDDQVEALARHGVEP